MPFYIQTPPLTPAQPPSSTISPGSQNQHLLAEDEEDEHIDVVQDGDDVEMLDVQRKRPRKTAFRPLIASEVRGLGMQKTASDSDLRKFSMSSSSSAAIGASSGLLHMPRPASNLSAGSHEMKIIDPLQTVQQFLQMHQTLMMSPSVPSCLSKLLIEVGALFGEIP
uniref:Uncharacterized protein n=1 Tax=Caenorhabditis japonica TaxID=281687 RepID=A0A8R1DMH8_CAEJA